VQAALRLASIQGLNGVTIGQVAAAARVTKGQLVQLLGNREALQLATLAAARDLFSSEVMNNAQKPRTAWEKLDRECLGWFDYVERRVLPGGCLITAASSEFRTIKGAVREQLISLRDIRKKRLKDLIRAARRENKKRGTLDVAEMVHQLLAYQAGANIAALLDDKAAFAQAKRATRALIETLA